jgi:hypothetical protein
MTQLTDRACTLTLVLLLSVACGEDQAASPASPSNEDNVARTLESLRLVDDHPLYTMRFYGDYYFDSRLHSQDTTAARLTGGNEGLAPWACTCFSALNPSTDAIFGRNFDWSLYSPALLLFTDPPNAYASVFMVNLYYLGYRDGLMPEDHPYFLLQAPYFPFDGMNEHGLAVGIMTVPTFEPDVDPAKPTLYTLELMRFLLDYAKTVDEAISLVGQVNVTLPHRQSAPRVRNALRNTT